MLEFAKPLELNKRDWREHLDGLPIRDSLRELVSLLLSQLFNGGMPVQLSEERFNNAKAFLQKGICLIDGSQTEHYAVFCFLTPDLAIEKSFIALQRRFPGYFPFAIELL